MNYTPTYTQDRWGAEAPTPKLGGNYGGDNQGSSALSGVGSAVGAALMSTNPVAGALVLLGSNLLAGWLARPQKPPKTPEEMEYERRMKYFHSLGRKREFLKGFASGITGKPSSYFDQYVGPTNLSDISDKLSYQIPATPKPVMAAPPQYEEA